MTYSSIERRLILLLALFRYTNRKCSEEFYNHHAWFVTNRAPHHDTKITFVEKKITKLSERHQGKQEDHIEVKCYTTVSLQSN